MWRFYFTQKWDVVEKVEDWVALYKKRAIALKLFQEVLTSKEFGMVPALEPDLFSELLNISFQHGKLTTCAKALSKS
jgi:hypothetical protein